jgi:UDP-glucose 4-epimerase
MIAIVTGVAGYIGSHIALELLNSGYQVVGIDDLSTGSQNFIDPRIDFHKVNIADLSSLRKSVLSYKDKGEISVIHAAGIKFAGESVFRPIEFYRTNFSGTINILEIMSEIGAQNLVFSSSCSVYGEITDGLNVDEDSILKPISPYGKSKYFAEIAINDFVSTGKIKAVSLRYFNVAGNGKSLGYDKSMFNLFPNIYRALQQNLSFNVYGNTYDTKDGSCIRDYVDVSILAKAHVATLERLRDNQNLLPAYNLGSGIGLSVLDIIKAVQETIYPDFRAIIQPARKGDPASILANISNAESDLNWKHDVSIAQILCDGWKAWERNNE